ncbi:hypothetical protein NQ317_018852 [Molorchus minor]|uniref:Malate dehydrogenase n=1 Tax=Molorchus minor TaxID=1323400 RepID=A0ABQ9J8V5_9CUCU|nr:hypothetical protein NQ317_018852 [Molorchus minor]
MWGGKKYLIGGLGEFWEYVFCYYGLESRIPKSELEKLAVSNLKFFQENRDSDELRMKRSRIIAILGATSDITSLAINDIINTPNLGKANGITIKLYDDLIHNQQNHVHLQEVAKSYNKICIFGDRDTVDVVTGEIDAVKDCDILLHFEDFRQEEGRLAGKVLRQMNCLSEVVNSVHNRNLRIILCNHGPVCFLATCLIEFCTTIRPWNIIAITADEGLSVIDIASKKTGVPVHRFSAPPVWGFVGLNSFVDMRNVVFQADVYRPNQRKRVKVVFKIVELVVAVVETLEHIYSKVIVIKQKWHMCMPGPTIICCKQEEVLGIVEDDPSTSTREIARQVFNCPRGSTLPLGTIKSELRLMPYLIEDHDEIITATQEKKVNNNFFMLAYVRVRVTFRKLQNSIATG